MSNKQQQDDEFKLELDDSKFSDAEKAAVVALTKQYRDAWLKKTSGLADGRKEQESKLADIQAKYEKAAQELTAVQQWWQTEGQFLTKAEAKDALEDAGLDQPNALMRELQALRNQFTVAQQKYDNTIGQLTDQNKSLEGALRLSNDLFNVRLKYPGADPERILNTAKEKGVQNLELAYQMAYGDEMKTKEIESAVATAREEERAKVSAERDIVETTPTSTRYTPPTESKSYGDASKNLLEGVRKSGGLPI